MMSAFFSISTRRVSISLYQRARFSSLVQGTFPASDLPTESLYNGRRHLTSAAGARKQVTKKKWEKKPNPPRYTSLAELGIKVIRPSRKFIIQGVTYYEKPLFMMHEKEAAAAVEKYADELGKKGSYWQQLLKYFF